MLSPQSQHEKQPNSFGPGLGIQRDPLLQKISQSLALEYLKCDTALAEAEIHGDSPQGLLGPFNQWHVEPAWERARHHSEDSAGLRPAGWACPKVPAAGW